LGRRDDLMSFFFVIMELLNEQFPWRKSKDDREDIKKVKERCVLAPQICFHFYNKLIKNELIAILNYIQTLKYEDTPDYNIIRKELCKIGDKIKNQNNNKNELNNDIGVNKSIKS